MSIPSRRTFATLALATLVLIFPGSAQPTARAGDPNINDAIAQQQRMAAQLAQQRDQLAALRRDQVALTANLASLATNLGRVGTELQAATDRLAQLTAQLRAARQQLADYEQRIANLQAELRGVAADIAQTRIDLARRELLLQDHLRSAYEQSQTSLLEVLLSSQSLTAAANELGFVLSLSDEDKRLADGIKVTRRNLEVRQQTLRDGETTLGMLRQGAAERATALDAQQRAVDAARTALAAKQAELRSYQRAQEASLAQTARNAVETQRLVAAGELALRGQGALVARLKVEADRLDIAYRGRFVWPELSRLTVTQEWGPTRFPLEPPYTYGGISYPHFHTGLDLASGCGTPIYAAGDGTVLAAGQPNAAYGDTAVGVVIGHSQRLQSWYWHLAREVVTVGQLVKAGQVIGYEGKTGLSTGCHLHFQVMMNEQTANPRLYLP